MFSIGPSSTVCFCRLSGCGKKLRSKFCGCCICGKSQALYFLGLIIPVVCWGHFWWPWEYFHCRNGTYSWNGNWKHWCLLFIKLTVCITVTAKCMNVKSGQAVIRICAYFGLEAYSLEKMDGVPDFTKALLLDLFSLFWLQYSRGLYDLFDSSTQSQIFLHTVCR